MSEEQLEFVKVGFVFSAALTILCGAVAPYGRGSELFDALGIYPVGVGFLVWPAVGYLLAAARSHFAASACLGAVAGFCGRARLTPHDPARMERLLGRYMGGRDAWDSRFVEILGNEDYIFVRFEPETAVVRDQSYELRGGRTVRPGAALGPGGKSAGTFPCFRKNCCILRRAGLISRQRASPPHSAARKTH